MDSTNKSATKTPTPTTPARRQTTGGPPCCCARLQLFGSPGPETLVGSYRAPGGKHQPAKIHLARDRCASRTRARGKCNDQRGRVRVGVSLSGPVLPNWFWLIWGNKSRTRRRRTHSLCAVLASLCQTTSTSKANCCTKGAILTTTLKMNPSALASRTNRPQQTTTRGIGLRNVEYCRNTQAVLQMCECAGKIRRILPAKIRREKSQIFYSMRAANIAT